MGKKSWFDRLMDDVDEAADTAGQASGQGATVTHNTITQDRSGTYVNGEKVSDSPCGSIQIGNGGVYVDGKRVG